MNFTEKIILWYKQNKRDLPWRNTQNPYYIWLSEIILQQTRVAQGLSYYQKFIQEFPTVADLANANEEQVLKNWQGLGYYSRARNLHKTAKIIVDNYNGIFPQKYEELLNLKGIGPYTAAAIASFSFKEPICVVDGNVFRVFSRYFGIKDDIAVTKNRKIFQKLGNEIIDIKEPDTFNQALMDFGATVCTPKKALCTECIFNNSCYAFSKNEVENLPINNKKIKTKDRFMHYIIAEIDNNIFIKKRNESDIWEGLYDFPLLELKSKNEHSVVENKLKKAFNLPSVYLYKDTIVHKLSHQNLHITFWKTDHSINGEYKKIEKEIAKDYAFPIVIWNHIVSKF